MKIKYLATRNDVHVPESIEITRFECKLKVTIFGKCSNINFVRCIDGKHKEK